MASASSSTLGAERASNPYLDPRLSEDAFVARLLAGVPPRPAYYARMKRLNSEGPAPTGALPAPEALPPGDLRDRVRRGAVVVDLRAPTRFGSGHVPGSLGIGLGPDLAVWGSWVLPYDRPLLLVADGDETVKEARAWLARVGLDAVEGYLDGGIAAWQEAGLELRRLDAIDPMTLAGRLRGGDVRLLDVRGDEEWAGGRIPGAIHIMAEEFPSRLDELAADEAELAVVCAGGYRSTVAGSLLLRAGVRRVLNVEAGVTGWIRAGLPIERA